MGTGYIYMIENKENGKKYIGRTVNYSRRMWAHKKSKRNLHSSYIDRSIQKHGEDNFGFKIIGEYERSKLAEKEKEYIKKYNTYKGEGYNLTPGGKGVGKGEEHWWYGKELSKETKEKISKANSGKNNGMYGITGENHHSYHNSKINKKLAMKVIDLYRFGNSMQKVADKLSLSTSTVHKIIKKKHWVVEELNTTYKTILKRINKRINKKDKPWLNIKVLPNQYYKSNSPNKIGTKIIKKIIKDKCKHEYSNAELGEKYGVSSSNISKIVRGKHPLTKVVKNNENESVPQPSLFR